jgi:hypothetical protein
MTPQHRLAIEINGPKRPRGRPRLTLEQAVISRDRTRERKRAHMRRYNQRPDVVARRLWYYDNVALPRMCGVTKAGT